MYWHSESRYYGDKILRLMFRRTKDGNFVEVHDESGCRHLGRAHAEIEPALEIAESVCEAIGLQPCQVANVSVDVLKEHLAKRAKLIVTYCQQDEKFAIVAGYMPYKWVDTELRFDSQEEARKILDESRIS
jgi:ribosome biogenesis SPOUT family RNA methylase Rps3